MKIAESDSAPMTVELALSNKYLTPAVQLAFLNNKRYPGLAHCLIDNPHANAPEMLRAVLESDRDDKERLQIRFAGTDRDFPNDILKAINADPTLALIHNAKTDPNAELELIEAAALEGADPEENTLLNYVMYRSRLLSEQAVRRLFELVGEKIRRNRHILKYPTLMKELGLTNIFEEK